MQIAKSIFVKIVKFFRNLHQAHYFSRRAYEVDIRCWQYPTKSRIKKGKKTESLSPISLVSCTNTHTMTIHMTWPRYLLDVAIITHLSVRVSGLSVHQSQGAREARYVWLADNWHYYYFVVISFYYEVWPLIKNYSWKWPYSWPQYRYIIIIL